MPANTFDTVRLQETRKRDAQTRISKRTQQINIEMLEKFVGKVYYAVARFGFCFRGYAFWYRLIDLEEMLFKKEVVLRQRQKLPNA